MAASRLELIETLESEAAALSMAGETREPLVVQGSWEECETITRCPSQQPPQILRGVKILQAKGFIPYTPAH